MSATASDPAPRPPAVAFVDGLRAALGSIFFYVLLGHYSGIGALAHEFGFTALWMVLCTLLIWAAPAQVIVISTLGTATLLEVAIAVTLSSVRLLPMVAALLPMLKREHTRQRELVLPMHLTAISVWAEGMRLLPGVRKEERVAFYNGLGIGLIFAATFASAAGFYLAAKLPPLLAAALLFLTPMSLLMSTVSNTRTLVDGLAFGLGLVVGPVIVAHKIGLDLLWTGLIAGTAAYAVHRVREARASLRP
jgi:predicted branched-subunit amino acid permease